jgi:hypothetical protein
VNSPTPPPRLSIPRLLIATASLSATVAAAAFLSPLPPSPIHAATGLHCPGCGGTRALRALAHGDLLAAARQNLFLVCSLPILTAALIRPSLHWLHGLPFLSPQTSHHLRRLRRLTIATLIALTIFTILRNLPPTSFLAPN